MLIHKRFDTFEEYDKWVRKYLFIDKIWKDEDHEILAPFFAHCNQRKEYKGEKPFEELFEYYKKCSEEYADEHAEMIKSKRHFCIEQLVDLFLYEYKHTDDEDDYDDLSEEEHNSIVFNGELNFPLIAIGVIESSFDRFGDSDILWLEFVEKKEFD
jgi:hypothetical protein